MQREVLDEVHVYPYLESIVDIDGETYRDEMYNIGTEMTRYITYYEHDSTYIAKLQKISIYTAKEDGKNVLLRTKHSVTKHCAHLVTLLQVGVQGSSPELLSAE